MHKIFVLNIRRWKKGKSFIRVNNIEHGSDRSNGSQRILWQKNGKHVSVVHLQSMRDFFCRKQYFFTAKTPGTQRKIFNHHRDTILKVKEKI